MLSTVPLYPMHPSLLPKAICNEIEKLCREENEGRDRVHLVKWKILCKSKQDGGLGLKNLHLLNKAFIIRGLVGV
jgi:hypothetical protein